MKWKLIIPIIFTSIFSESVRTAAHGVKIEYQSVQAIEIDAKFDTGEPMSEAQVTVYAPDNPSTPWLTATSDKNGKFVFAPDYSKPGTWAIQLRKAGHGELINLPIAQDNATVNNLSARISKRQSTSRSFTPLQLILMGAAGIWGFIGTALYFSRGTRSKSNAHS